MPLLEASASSSCMSRNAVRATSFFKIPPPRVVEIGIQVEL